MATINALPCRASGNTIGAHLLHPLRWQLWHKICWQRTYRPSHQDSQQTLCLLHRLDWNELHWDEHGLGLHPAPSSCLNAWLCPRSTHLFLPLQTSHTAASTIPTCQTYGARRKSTVYRDRKHFTHSSQRRQEIHLRSHRHFSLLCTMRRQHNACSTWILSRTTGKPYQKHHGQGHTISWLKPLILTQSSPTTQATWSS